MTHNKSQKKLNYVSKIWLKNRAETDCDNHKSWNKQVSKMMSKNNMTGAMYLVQENTVPG